MHQEAEQTSTVFPEQKFSSLVEGLRALDYSKQSNRRFLVASYRKFEKLVNKRHQFCILSSNDNEDIIEEVLKYSESIKPYMIGDITQPLESQVEEHYDKGRSTKMIFEEYVGMRKCFPVKIRVDGQLIQMDPQRNSKTIYKNLQFSLTLESEPESLIFYSTNKKHPLLVDDVSDRVECNHRHQVELKSPCTLCVIAVSNYKLESDLSILHVKSSQNHGHLSSVRENIGGITRPNQKIDLDESISLNESVLNIDRYSHSS